MPRLFQSLLFFTLIIFGYGEVDAQGKFLSQQIDNRSGLSNSCINTIFQDSDHLLWIGTWDGLNLFDGNNIRVFNISKNHSTSSIANNVIYNVTEDKTRQIWISTLEGISRFDKLKGTFTHFFYNENIVTNSIKARLVLTQDPKGDIYVSSQSGDSVLKYSLSDNQFHSIGISLQGHKISNMLFDGQGILYLLLDNGSISIYSPYGNSYRQIKTLRPPAGIISLFLVHGKITYVTGDHSLYQFNSGLSGDLKAVLPHDVRFINYWEGHYIISWSTKGVAEYDENFREINLFDQYASSLSGVRVSFIYPGSDILWLGTEGNGITKIKKKQDRFGLVLSPGKGTSSSIPVRAFCEVNGEIWVGSKGNGITVVKGLGTANESYSFMNSFRATMDIFDNCVYAIEKGSNNLVYIGSDAPGITIYNTISHKTTSWYNIIGTADLPYFNSVHCIVPDDDGSLWIGSESSGLIHLKISQSSSDHYQIKLFEQYLSDGTNRSLGNNVIYTLANGSGNNLWVGCRYGGLSLFNKVTHHFSNFKAYTYKEGLSNNDVLSLFFDSKKRIWVGTSYGLNWIDEKSAYLKSPVFHKIDPETGLPNNTVHAITEDQEGFIWASTNKGISKINPVTSKVIQFKESDGLQSNEFSDNAVYKSNTGRLFFGGIYGFNYFDPEKVQNKNNTPNLLVAEILVSGKNDRENAVLVLKPDGKSAIGNYTLGPQNNFFEFKVKPIDLSSPEKCRYMYSLVGNDKVWHNLEPNSKISYGNIPPGDYALKVKWSDGEGLWTQEVTVFQIRVKQYFWLTLPAILIYLLVTFSVAYAVHRYRKNKMEMHHRLQIEHMLREKDEEVHQQQLDFFTNIAHELQTPLTIILGSIERFLFKNDQEKRTLAYKNFLVNANNETSRLQYMVYQLLEFRKAETGNLESSVEYIDISAFLENIADLFQPLADSKSLEFTRKIDRNIFIGTDRDKLEKIVFNLLSNAFKHSSENEHVIFSLTQPTYDHFEIVIANSGCNLTDEDLPQLFDRFFTVHKKHFGRLSSGIGLAFTRQLVACMKGQIGASLKNRWIEFKVVLPFTQYAAQPSPVTGKNDSQPSYLLQSIIPAAAKQHNKAENNNKESLILGLTNQQTKKLLVVEDEDEIRYLLKDILQEEYIVYEASNGHKAIQLMKQTIPDLVITDIMMPDMDGMELCTLIKNTPDTCHIPVIMLTAKGTIEQKIEGYEAGADAYLPKPIHSKHLLVRVKHLLDYRDKLKAVFEAGNYHKNIEESGIRDEDQHFLKSILKLVEENLELETLNADFLEQNLMISKRDLYRKVKFCSGMTPAEFIKNIRLQNAAHYLKSTDLTVSEIFYRTGFANQSHFYREFRKKFDTTPNDFRSLNRLPVL